MKRFGKPHPMFPPFPEGSRVIFYGDSITRLGGGVLRVAAQYRALFPGDAAKDEPYPDFLVRSLVDIPKNGL